MHFEVGERCANQLDSRSEVFATIDRLPGRHVTLGDEVSDRQ